MTLQSVCTGTLRALVAYAAMAYLFLYSSATASASEPAIERENVICVLDTIYVDAAFAQDKLSAKERESLFPQASRSLEDRWFTWGADLGASIDISTDDMSTFDINLMFGYKNKLIRTAGIGVGIHQAFSNGHSFIPVYGMFRSYFSRKYQLIFGEVRCGYSFNTISNSHSQGGVCAGIGVGIDLAKGRNFRSHLILGYGWMGMKPYNDPSDTHKGKHINYAVLRFGISF